MGYFTKVRRELAKSFDDSHSDREIAASFSIGVFITSLPTLGTGFLVFAILMKSFAWISNLAMIASAVVLNPIVKPVFWIASINLGALIITGQLAFTRNPETAVTYLIVGNLIIAVISASVAYYLSLGAVKRYRQEIEQVVKPEVQSS